jgi:outer membrane immunogenic protein
MKKRWIATAALVAAAWGPALAADMPVKAPIYKAPPAFNWTGCYLGIEGGSIWGRSRATNADPAVNFGVPRTSDFNLSGGLAGGTVGCNYQTGSFVIGIEDDISWTNKTGTTSEIPPFAATTTDQISERWIDTLRGRAGWAWDRFFVYGTGGAAWAMYGRRPRCKGRI